MNLEFKCALLHSNGSLSTTDAGFSLTRRSLEVQIDCEEYAQIRDARRRISAQK